MSDMSNLPASMSDGGGTAMSLVMDSSAMTQMILAAELMASAKVTIPKHLQNSKGDCMAVILQAAQWKMNPFAVAQKTHLSQGGSLGYEAQLIGAVLVSSGAIKDDPEYEFLGDWDRILGRVVERTGSAGGKYYAADWPKKDEEGLGVIIRATLRREHEPREMRVMMSQCYPRFSTQWATDPQQQITYVAVRKFGRRHAPGAILGVYTTDELPEFHVGEREINPREDRVPGEPDRKPEKKPEASKLEQYPEKRFTNMLAQVKKNVDDGVSLKEAISAAVTFIAGKKQEFSPDQIARLEAIKPAIHGDARAVEDEPPGDAPATYAEVAELLNKAKTMDALDEAADLIGAIGDEAQRRELGDIFNVRRIELEGK